MQNKNIYSVGQINNYIKNMFAQDFLLKRISIKGEVSNCKYHSSGHIYFTLKDSSGTISAIMFAGSRKGLSFQMKDGDQVVVTGSVEIYEKSGSYQIYARQIERDGEGNLYLKFEELKRELEEMGMFDASYKQPIPRFVRKVGIVTAPTGAAVRDIKNIATRRNPYVQLILYPALVQGEGAAESIVSGIHALERMDVDVIIVGRGGGSIEDLWAFNEEIVARAIFDCPIPIISAVGHETDWTIADFVSDLRAPTPSAAAELAVFDYSLVHDQMENLHRRMNNNLYRQIELARTKADTYRRNLGYLSPANRLNENRKRLADLEDKIDSALKNRIAGVRHEMALYATRLEALSPAKKISQGYAFVTDSKGKALKSVTSIDIDDELEICLIDGSIKAAVLEVNKYE